jgi:hypothetical protein
MLDMGLAKMAESAEKQAVIAICLNLCAMLPNP